VDVYFSCAITGGRRDQPAYAAIVDVLQDHGHTVLTAHLTHPDILKQEARLDPRSVYRRDMAWLAAAQAVVAEISTPSHGVGYEIARALHAGKPVLCLYRAGARVSKILLGNDQPGLVVCAYESGAEAAEAARAFLERLAASE
jgi:hypothetical protein